MICVYYTATGYKVHTTYIYTYIELKNIYVYTLKSLDSITRKKFIKLLSNNNILISM